VATQHREKTDVRRADQAARLGPSPAEVQDISELMGIHSNGSPERMFFAQ